MAMNNKEKGQIGEDRVVSYLESKGYRILEKNYRNRIAEIDIVALDEQTICFIEVKTRKGNRFGLPREAITKKKIRKIILGAQSYLSHKKLHSHSCRFDVIEVYLNENQIEHIENAFWL
jgi:putative endonuclease